MDILDAAAQALTAQGHPLHYKELAAKITQLQLYTIGGKDPGYTVYAKLYYDIRDFPAETRFEFLKRGIFGLKGQQIDDLKALIPGRVILNPRKRKDGTTTADDPYYGRRANMLKEEQRCGNCAHLEWEGINIISHRSGVCENYKSSERITIYANDPPCAYWKMRTLTQRMQDDENQANDYIKLTALNASVHATRRKKEGDK